ncbi:YfcC family protein [Fulvivirga sediminis]|uniref:YfcC family protein n=1 Tax=Fulvivirga sediminis TaxID=2803949 RepID=A0A937F5N7_9BACT|nr:YfcC family protein [Fulvivirga sediminis]MBL3655417.1 YfcC family protein [Fulvivirga sediminis]
MKGKFQFPTPYTVLIIVIVLCAGATWLLPSGSYDKLTYSADSDEFVIHSLNTTQVVPANQNALISLGIPIQLEKFRNGSIKKPISIPNSYKKVEGTPQGFKEVLFAPIRGIYEVVDIMLFVLVLGGFIGVFNHSGAFDKGIALLAQRLKGREGILIIVVTSLVAVGGTTFGMAEETFAFYPFLIPVFIAAGYDLLVPVAVIFIGSSIGNMGAVINPFSTIIASDAAGVSWTIGFFSRLAMLLVGTAICVAYVLRYAKKVKKNPAVSLVSMKNVDSQAGSAAVQAPIDGLKTSTKVLFALFALSFAVMIYGVARLNWWFEEMTALFLVASILIGLIQRINERAFVDVFITGAKELLGVSFIVGIARGVTFILNDGHISDTILFYATKAVDGMPSMVFMPALMLVFFVLTLFISSTSGLAVVSMPILSALGPVVGVPQEEIVNAYLFGCGLMTFITPTGLVLPSLAMVNVNYNTWLKFIWPLLIILAVVAVIILWLGVVF